MYICGNIGNQREREREKSSLGQRKRHATGRGGKSATISCEEAPIFEKTRNESRWHVTGVRMHERAPRRGPELDPELER